MREPFVFFAIVDANNNVVTITHHQFNNVKAVFSDYREAVKALAENIDKYPGLTVKPAHIVPAE